MTTEQKEPTGAPNQCKGCGLPHRELSEPVDAAMSVAHAQLEDAGETSAVKLLEVMGWYMHVESDLVREQFERLATMALGSVMATMAMLGREMESKREHPEGESSKLILFSINNTRQPVSGGEVEWPDELFDIGDER